MTNVTLADAPRFVRRRPGHRQAVLDGGGPCGIDVGFLGNPPAHPDAARIFVVAGMLRHRSAARALSAEAKEDLNLVIGDAAERRRLAPGSFFHPAKLREP